MKKASLIAKKALIILLACATVPLGMFSCTEPGQGNESDTPPTSDSVTQPDADVTDEAAVLTADADTEPSGTQDPETVGSTETENGTDEETEVTTDTETEEEDTRTVMDIYEDGYNVNMLVGFDEQGHSINAVSEKREDKYVGIFYFLWLGQPYASDIYDVSKLLETEGKETLFFKTNKTSPAGQAHWWAEPLFGYYNSSDEWVVRKHMEMLTDAGVDFLIFDTTNAVTYDNVAKLVMKVITELRAEGWDAPQVVYYTHSYSIQTIKGLYERIYQSEVYPDAWFRVDGKPMIIGYDKEKTDVEVAGDASYHPGDLPQELCDYFYLRQARWPYDPVVPNGWPYTEWQYPQPLNTDMVNVSIATHPMVPFSFSLTHENWCNWGRGYNPRSKQNNHDDIMKGTFYDYEWSTAYKKDPKFVMVTGWNEWIAYKQMYQGEYMLCDNVDMEYSRDAEPMMGGYEDAYFIQTIASIRRYKYKPIDGFRADTVSKTVDINGPVSQWDDVKALYTRVGTDNGKRSSYGGAKTVSYACDEVVNNILSVKVTYDSDNLYFLIRTEKDIVTYDSELQNFMNVFIGLDRPAMDIGWEGYSYVVNRTRSDGHAVIEKLNADYSGDPVGLADYAVSGCYMTLSIPRRLVGADSLTDIYFKVSDGVDAPSEIMNYYASGRSLPMGRLSYLFQFGKIGD